MSRVATAPQAASGERGGLHPVVALVQRCPWTATVAVVMLVLGVVSAGVWRPLEDSAWWDQVAYGLPPLEAGRWWTPVTGSFFASQPLQYLPVVVGFVLMCGLCEWRLGTRRAALVAVVGQLAGVLGALGLLALVRGTSWEWAQRTATETGAGFSAGAVCALLVAAVSLPAPWRARLLLGTLAYCFVTLVWIGDLLDLSQMIAALVGVAFALPRLRAILRTNRGTLTRHEYRILASALLVVIGVAQILYLEFPEGGMLGKEGDVAVTRPLLILFVIVQLMVALGLPRGSRFAWYAAMTVSVLGLLSVLTLHPWLRVLGALVLYAPLFLLLLRTRGAYTASVVPATRSRVLRDSALVVLTFLAYLVLGFTVIDDWDPGITVGTAAKKVVGRLFFQTTTDFRPTTRHAEIFLDTISLIPMVILLTILLLVLVRTRRPPTAVERDRVVALLHEYGGGNLSWMATWEENAHFLTRDGKAALAYQVHSGTAIALGDPVGSPESTAHAVTEFARHCETHGWVPCLFSVTGVVLPQSDALGWRHAQVAEDTVIDLPSLQFKGKAWQDVRTALNRAAKSGVTFRLVKLQDESFSMVQQARGISDQWVSDKGMPEMGFTLGGIDEALDPEVRVGLAVDETGVLQGITSWLPVYGPDAQVRGWTLDVMRRRPDGFRPVMEFMIASACLAFKEQGALTVSLSGAPLARSDDEEDLGAVEELLNRLGELLEPVYGFRSLHQFKTKFKPRYVPMYLCYPDEAALPRIGVGLTQAFLPGARLRDYASILSST